jgi:CRP-like cAMP-binding protein
MEPNAEHRSSNLILNSLPADDYEWLQPHLQDVELLQGEILHRIGQPIDQVYFPTSGFLSWVNLTLEGDEVEVGAAGNEGMTGVPLLLGETTIPHQIEVQVAGRAMKLQAEVLVESLNRSTAFQQKVKAFTYFKIVQLTQSALCNRFHSVEERLCRWLLAAQDRVECPEFALTRDMLAQMIGARRPAVSIVTGTLQAAGLISAERGRITILNRKEMEASACECYGIVKRGFDRYLAQLENHQKLSSGD